MSTTLNDSFWLERITQCRSSGLTDRQWCIENGIPVSTFYYHVRNLTRQEYRWLLEGLSIDKPKAIRPAGRKDF